MGSSGAISRFKEDVQGREITNEDTLEDYLRWIKRYERWRGDRSATEGTVREFDAYLDDPARPDYPWTNDRGGSAPGSYSYRTRVKALSAVKLWFRRHHDVEISTEVQNLAIGEATDEQPTVLSQRDVKQVIADATDCQLPGCAVAIQLGYDAILRGKELTLVERGDLDLEYGTLYVRAQKGSNQITLGLDKYDVLEDSTVRLLRDHVAAFPDRDRLFHNSYGRAWRPDAWSQHFQREHHPEGFHAFARHSRIIHLLEAGVPFGEVYRRSRHASPQMMTRYGRMVGVEIPDWAES